MYKSPIFKIDYLCGLIVAIVTLYEFATLRSNFREAIVGG